MIRKKSGWKPVESKELRQKVRQIVLELASLLKNPQEVVKKVTAQENNLTAAGFSIFPWSALSLSNGFPSIALFYGELDRLFPNDGWDEVGFEYLQWVQKAFIEEEIENLSLWSGICGVLMAVRSLSREGTRYQNMMKQLHDVYLSDYPMLLDTTLSELHEGARAEYYDVVDGWSGIGRYLLFNKHDPQLTKSLKEILIYLVQLCEDKEINQQLLPGWFIPDKHHMSIAGESMYPYGLFNLGLAHGIPGPLALLSIALLQGVEVPRQREAIMKITEWLIQWKQEDEYGLYWPFWISEEDYQKGRLKEVQTRAAWCYGTPGISRALLLAGRALDDSRYQQIASDSFLSVFRRPEQEWKTNSPTFCHGYIGLLQMTQRMLADTNNKELFRYRDYLLEKVLDFYDHQAPLRFYEMVMIKTKSNKVTNAGLLSGVAGIGLTLLSLISDQEPEWDSVFLIN
ncbi:lanthionine synthetase C family protein [Thermoflavimicrobium daqui]|nr:lanthionine synthetase C family protein [Thermoflavimicrobium daqui]